MTAFIGLKRFPLLFMIVLFLSFSSFNDMLGDRRMSPAILATAFSTKLTTVVLSSSSRGLPGRSLRSTGQLNQEQNSPRHQHRGLTLFSTTTTGEKEPASRTERANNNAATEDITIAEQHISETRNAHTFWRKERSFQEVEAHIYKSLAKVDDLLYSSDIPGKRDSIQDDCSASTEFTDMYCYQGLSANEGLSPVVQVLSAEPPLVVIHDFLSTSACEELIQAANKEGLHRSKLGAQQRVDQARTSSTMWLREKHKQHSQNVDDDADESETPSTPTTIDPVLSLRLIAEKVSCITGLPSSHMENLQIARYRQGQEFDLHTDHQNSFNDIDIRGRLATCIVYLSAPTSGGETWFPATATAVSNSGTDSTHAPSTPLDDVDFKIAPTQGSAVLFWNTLEKPGCPDYDPYMFLTADLRMQHAGLPVHAGEKWICNRWIHPIDIGSGVRGV